MKFHNAHRYTSKAFRHGATQEILQPGGTLEVIKSSGAWLGNGYRSYVDLEYTRARQISRLLIALGDSSSDDEEHPPKTKAAETQHSAELHSANADPPESDSPSSETSPMTHSIYGFPPNGFSDPFPKFKYESEITYFDFAKKFRGYTPLNLRKMVGSQWRYPQR